MIQSVDLVGDKGRFPVCPGIRKHERVNVSRGPGLFQRCGAHVKVQRTRRAIRHDLILMHHLHSAVVLETGLVGRRSKAGRAVCELTGLPLVNAQKGHARGGCQPVHQDHITAQAIHHLRRGQGQLLLDVIQVNGLVHTQMLQQTMIRQRRNARDARAAHINGHAVRGFVVERCVNALAAGHVHGLW